MNNWTPVTECLPDSERPVLVVAVLPSYVSAVPRRVVLRAIHVNRFEVESTDDNDYEEYDEKTDNVYIVEGWYECCELGDDGFNTYIGIKAVTHWMPLPALPEINNAL